MIVEQHAVDGLLARIEVGGDGNIAAQLHGVAFKVFRGIGNVDAVDGTAIEVDAFIPEVPHRVDFVNHAYIVGTHLRGGCRQAAYCHQ